MLREDPKNVFLLQSKISGPYPSIVRDAGETPGIKQLNQLLPIILSEETLPIDVLRDCQLAIALRQNVVHNGQRDVDEVTLARVLRSIRTCCEALDFVTK